MRINLNKNIYTEWESRMRISIWISEYKYLNCVYITITVIPIPLETADWDSYKTENYSTIPEDSYSDFWDSTRIETSHPRP